jgi:hypothetical protein
MQQAFMVAIQNFKTEFSTPEYMIARLTMPVRYYIFQCLIVLVKDGNLKDVFGQIDYDSGSMVHVMGSFGCGDHSL